jgi:D-xylulose reductase
VLFPITAVCTRRLTVKDTVRYVPGAYPAAIDLISSGEINVKKLITNKFKFEESGKAFDLVRQGRQDMFKVMIE